MTLAEHGEAEVMRWKSLPLADIADINPAWSRETMDRDEEVTFVPMSGISTETASITQPETRRLGYVMKGYTSFSDRDILVAKITPCFENGKIAHARLTHRYGFGSTEFHVLRVRRDVLDDRFLLHYLRQDRVRRDGEQKMTGSAGQRRVPRHFLDSLAIPLPPLPEQWRIADILDRAEAVRANRRAALALLDTLTQAIFLDIFGDPVTNPKGWPRLPLDELMSSKPQNGLYKPSSEYGSGTPILRIDSFYDGIISERRSLKRVAVSESEQRAYGLAVDDIVINRVNSIEYLGKSALVTVLDEATVFESNMMRFRIDTAKLHPRFLIQFLQSDFIKAQIRTRAKHAVNQSSINQQDVRGFFVNMPPLLLQKSFAARVSAVEKLKSVHRSALAKLDELFAALQHRAFRGEL